MEAAAIAYQWQQAASSEAAAEEADVSAYNAERELIALQDEMMIERGKYVNLYCDLRRKSFEYEGKRREVYFRASEHCNAIVNQLVDMIDEIEEFLHPVTAAQPVTHDAIPFLDAGQYRFAPEFWNVAFTEFAEIVDCCVVVSEGNHCTAEISGIIPDEEDGILAELENRLQQMGLAFPGEHPFSLENDGKKVKLAIN